MTESNRQLTPLVYEMDLYMTKGQPILPGQFVNVKLEGLYLRRPISVCNYENGTLTLVYKSVGKGTEAMSRMKSGETLDVLFGLGSGYHTERAGREPVLIGGGVGVPPLYMLARQLKEQGRSVHVILGFNTEAEVFYEKEFRALGADVCITTADGSCGRKGFVTDALAGPYSYFYACGPMPMLKAVYRSCACDGEFSLEERMGCGFGACMGCSVQTASGNKRVCKDGPVFRKGDLLWDD